MIKSMTGFASLTREGEAATVTVTVKGVNHRFLDLQVRMPGALASSEPRLRALVQQKIARGRIELMISVQARAAAAPVQIEVNDAVVEALSAALERARERGLVSGTLTPGDLLRFPQAIAVTEQKDTLDPASSPRSRRRSRTRSTSWIACGRAKARTCARSSTRAARSSAICSNGRRLPQPTAARRCACASRSA